MFDGIFRSNFRTKCKSLLRRIRTRLEMIKKRRNAMQRFLKKDIADLLNNNLDRNAYGRAEGLYMELILSSCYEFVEQCGTCIVQNLKEMHKQSDCPEHCRVAVASLIYAAARFADLPELRNLRNHFIDKYGKTIESFVKREFVEGLKPKPPTTEMKLKLMHEIAQEFSVVWDSSNLEQHLQTPSRDPAQFSSDNGVNGGGRHLSRNKSCLGSEKGKHVDTNEDETVTTKTRRRSSLTDFKENITDKLQDQNHLQEEIFPENNAHRKPFTNRVVPAPNTISNIQTNEDINHTNENDDDRSFGKPKPRPKSVRTKYLQPSASTNQGIINSNNSEYELDLRENLSARVTRAKRKELLSDEEEDDDDEKFENLSTYMGGNSSSSTEENGTPKFYLPPPPGKRRYLFSESPPGSPVKEAETFQRKPSEKSRFFTPEEQKTEMVRSPIRHARSNSGHQVHPKMPDYDELAERIAILKNA